MSHRRPPPRPPRYDRLPVAVQHSLRLRGALVSCGPGLRGVGWPETPSVRLIALAPWLEHDSIASHLTAAWVWGAARAPGSPLHLTLRAGRRAPVHDTPQVRFHEQPVQENEKRCFGQLAVTSPLRTLVDLLYAPSPHSREEQVACRLLYSRRSAIDHAALLKLRDHRRPHSVLARGRIETLMAQTL